MGRWPIGVARMLRMRFLQQWYGLDDEALEEAIYDSQSMRGFVGVDLFREAVPDATARLKFRRLLEEHVFTAQLFKAPSLRTLPSGACCCARARWCTPPSSPHRQR